MVISSIENTVEKSQSSRYEILKEKKKKSWGKDGESIKNQRKKNNGGVSDTKEGKYQKDN